MTAFDTSVIGALDSYTKLKVRITDETDGRADDTALDSFILSAEAEIRRFLADSPVRPMRTRSSLTVATEYVTCPTGMVRPISVEVTLADSTKRRVPFVSPERLSQAQVEASSLEYPVMFTREGEELRFWPVPATSLTGDIFYFQRLEGISEANQSNWMLDDHPDVYLAGSLYYAYRHMPDIEKASLMKGIFEEALSRVAYAYPDPADETTMVPDPTLELMGRYSWQF